MKKLCLSLLILSLIGHQMLCAQTISHAKEDELIQKKSTLTPKNQWFVALGGGIAAQTAFPNYSVVSTHLTNSSVGSASPYIWGKLGCRFYNKHQASFILEKTEATNSFAYLGDHGEGLGLNRGISYVFGNLEYSYNLLNAKRFWLGPTVQIALGAGDTSGTAFYDRGKDNFFTTPQGLSYHKYDIVRAEVPSLVFSYGIGLTFGVEVIDDRFYIGTELRWLHSLGAIHEYEIDYQDNSKNLNFVVNSPLMNIHFGLQLAYLFGERY